jgi:ABC-type uncharacterized transport system substrate-binding protein
MTLKRRVFIALFVGVVAWPSALRAQGKPVIGFLHSATAKSYEPTVGSFRQGLRDVGYFEGDNVAIEYRWANNQLDRLPALAADLVQRSVQVIFTGGALSVSLAAKAATSTIPIVFVNGTDPVEVGLVASLNRPGGNITGINFLVNLLGQKKIEVLREITPDASSIAVLVNPKILTADAQLKDFEQAAQALGLRAHRFLAGNERELDEVFGSLPQLAVGGLAIGADAFLFSRRDQLVALAARYSIPTVYPWREAPAAGGLMSYGASITDAYRHAGVYAGRILNGEKPADLPIHQSTKVELVINLKTAKALGIIVSPKLLARVDEVIE